MNEQDYIKNSLELHLFFDRIMKEHSLFLNLSFTEKNNDMKEIAQNFQQKFSQILSMAIYLSNGNLSKNFLNSEEIVTKNTLQAETMTASFTGIPIETDITQKELHLTSGLINNEQLKDEIKILNRQTLPIIQNLIRFKNEVLSNVLNCYMYTTNYPLLLKHIINEAKMYYDLLNKLEFNKNFSNQEFYQQEIFWNKIMQEHAEFIRGLLDPSESELIHTANQFANEYQQILNNPQNLKQKSLKETIKFRNFKIDGEKGILNCKIKSIIIPLLSDHVLREANHFTRLLTKKERKND